MVFSHIARVVAVIVLVYGASTLLMGLTFALEWGGFTRDMMGVYTASTTGELIDRGIYRILIALALGTLAEIALAIRKNRAQ